MLIFVAVIISAVMLILVLVNMAGRKSYGSGGSHDGDPTMSTSTNEVPPTSHGKPS